MDNLGSAWRYGIGMKSVCRLMVFVVLGLLPEVMATAVGTGTMLQPMNMGPDSDPKRIPVGRVPNESNHGYGTLELITEPFPLLHGGWRWEGGIEMNGNLPSAFGISVEPEDTTNVPSSPVVIRVRKQAVPGYSPYTKEQVLLATMRCLLDVVRATELRPLKVTVEVEDEADAGLKKYSGNYITERMGEEEFVPTPLPGVSKEVTMGGMEMIVFDEVKEAEDAKKPAEPFWVVFPIEGEMDGGMVLLPGWQGNMREGELLSNLGRPWPVVNDRFDPSRGDPDANVLTRRELSGNFRATRGEDGTDVYLGFQGDQTAETRASLAAACWAAVLTERPTRESPLTIRVRLYEEVGEEFEAWIDAGWTKGEIGDGDPVLEGNFVWNVEQGKLTEGKIPDLSVRPGVSGGWVLFDPDAEKEIEEAEIP